MKKTMKWALTGLAGLIGLPLLLGLAWLLINRVDVAPQPWPEALALPRNQVPDGENLLLQIAAAPRPEGVRLADCQGDDCVTSWRLQLPAWRDVQARNAAFGERCEALTAPQSLQAEDPLPDRMHVDFPLPPFQPILSCHSWLLGNALLASEAADLKAALHWLRQADRLDRALLGGTRSLIGHMVTQTMWGRKLLAIAGIAERHPELATNLQSLVALDPKILLARQRDWMVVEANFARAAIDSLRGSYSCEPALLPIEWTERVMCRLGDLALQPEYATQLISARMLKVQALAVQTPDAAGSLLVLQPLFALEQPRSLWVSMRHTVPLFLDDVARPNYLHYLERAADLQLAAEATALWLRRAAPSEASPALRARLQTESGWQLRPFSEQSRGRLPLRWPPLT